MVLIDPALPPEARHRQIRVVKYAVPALILTVAALLASLLLASASVWVALPASVIGLVWLLLSIGMVPGTRVVVHPTSRLVELVFGRWAPARFRAMVTSVDHQDMHHLHQMLIRLSRQDQVAVASPTSGQRDDVVTVLWSTAADLPRISSAELLRTINTNFAGEHDLIGQRTWPRAVQWPQFAVPAAAPATKPPTQWSQP